MECEVIVVGAGIGGLTTAALLAQRGVDVCLFERQSQVGGCAANFEHLGYTFEPTFGLYAGWEDEGTWPQIFSALKAPAPQVTNLSPSYVVRLPGSDDVRVVSDERVLEEEIADAFPDCADAAIRFLRTAMGESGSWNPAELLGATSRSFRWFIDAQLQMFAQCTSVDCPPERVSEAMRLATGELWSVNGGAQVLADRLADSLKASGGSLRLNSPVLRLAYGNDGLPVGVDLLNGERVIATRAIVSNLTVWDTYGKLVGPSRTPKQVAAALRKASAWGVYQIFLGIDESTIKQLPAQRMLLSSDSEAEQYDPEQQQMILNVTDASSSAPAGKHAVTVSAFTQPEEWFSFHDDHTWHEEKDQKMLETCWTRLHRVLPELGDSAEVIETRTPQTSYEDSRRRFGMMGTPVGIDQAQLTPPFPNLFLVGDTAASTLGLKGTAESAVKVVKQVV